MPLAGLVPIMGGAPVAEECGNARALREQIASYAGLHDCGFLGSRALGAQLQ